MPQPRPVVLNYVPAQGPASFGPTPRRVRVAPSDTIRFRISPATRIAKPNCKLRITIHDGRFFTQTVLEHSTSQTGEEELTVSVRPVADAELTAAAGPSHILTGYKCELLDQHGAPLPGLVSDGSGGGEIVPDSSAP
jgi:hypothetical protein